MIEAAVYDTKPYDREYLENAPAAAEIHWRFLDFRLNAQTAATAKGALAVCAFVNDVIDRACLEVLAAQNIKHLAMRCAGFNNVDLRAAKELGIEVTRVPAYSPHAVAEHAVTLLMAVNRKICRAYNRVREHNFSLQGLVGTDIYGKTAGIIGTGKIGKITGEILRGFGVRLLAYDPFPSAEWAAKNGAEYCDLQALLRSSDIVSLHVPLLPETFHILNAETFALMKPGAFLVNTSRGKLIDTPALIDALKSKHLGGVGLDVYEEEEGIFFEDISNDVLQDDDLSRLLTFPNVLITSHQAFLTTEALAEIARVTAENVALGGRDGAFIDGTVVS